MRQIKLAGEGIGVLLHKEVNADFLGEIQKEDGTFVSRMQLILEALQHRKVNEAFLLVNALKYKMSLYDFTAVSDWFLKLLRKRQEEEPDLVSEVELVHYGELLRDLL